jgi:hypothetical protein
MLVISLQVIEHLAIILVLILCITICIANGGATRIRHVIVRCPPPPLFDSIPPRAKVHISCRFLESFHRYNNLFH